MMKLPRIHPSHRQERQSIAALQKILSADLFLLRAEDGGDYGVDRILEAVRDDEVTNLRCHIQVKSKRQNNAANDTLTYSVPIKTINYLLNTVNSAFLVYSVAEDVFYWEWTRQIALRAGRKGLDLSITRQKSFAYTFTHQLTREGFETIHSKLVSYGELERLLDAGGQGLDLHHMLAVNEPGVYRELLFLYLRDEYDVVVGLGTKAAKRSIAIRNIVSLSLYHLRRYRDALRLLTATRPPEDFEGKCILAMIYCEMGAEERKTKLIELARGTMESTDRSTWRASEYYNFGNILSGLESYEEAIEYYRQALDREPRAAMVWKNLAGCYFHLGDHVAELDCLDRALALDGDLLEALYSKAATVGTVLADRAQAIALLGRALAVPGRPDFDRSNIYWWLAKFQSDDQDVLVALETVDRGLSLDPGNEHLETLRRSLIVAHWRWGDELREQAIEYLRQLIKVRPKAFPARVQLVRIYADSGDNEQALEYLLSTFEELGFDCSREAFGRFPLEDLLRLLGCLGTYLNFRARQSVADLIFESFGISQATMQQIELTFAVYFARLVEIISPNRDQDELAAEVDAYVATFLGVNEICSELIIAAQDLESIDQKAEAVSGVVVALPEITLRELSRQVGSVLHQNGYGAKATERVFSSSERVGMWLHDSIEPILTGAHNVIPWSNDPT